MKDLTKHYIDLSKCTEDQRKHIVQILNATGKYILWDINDAVDFLIHYNNRWCTTYEKEDLKGKTELTYPDFIKLFEGGDEVRTELLPDVAYWRYRCLLAEKCLSVSPCDPDITDEQIKAHKDYNQYLETFGKKD